MPPRQRTPSASSSKILPRAPSASSSKEAPPAAAAPAPAPARTISVRNYHFHLPADRVLSWHGAGLHATAFNNALSVFFPLGETFFIHAVKRYMHVVPQGSQLQLDVEAFVGQEAIHSREHDAYNAALRPHYWVSLIEGVLWCVLFPFECVPPLALAGTVALEHLTASLGHLLVSDESLMTQSEPHFAELWYWHAVEETEHKGAWGRRCVGPPAGELPTPLPPPRLTARAHTHSPPPLPPLYFTAVAFDVYERAFGKGLFAYALRVFALGVAMTIFFALFIPTFLYFVVRAGGLLDFGGWAGLARHHWGSGGPAGEGKGMMRRMGPLLRHYFRRDFHPWDHDNAVLLKPLQPPSASGKGERR